MPLELELCDAEGRSLDRLRRTPEGACERPSE
jgi:hypothetical protein